MPIINLPLVPFIIINLAISIFVLLQNKKSLVNQTFTAFVVNLTLWIASNFIIDNYKIFGAPEFWTKTAFSVGIFIPFFFLLFTLSFRGLLTYPIKGSRLLKIVSLPFIFSFVSLTDLIVAKVSVTNGTIEVFPGSLNSFWYLIFVSYFSYAFWNLINEYRRGSFLRKQQIRYLLAGTFATLFLGLLFNFILPLVQGNLGLLASYTPYTVIIMEFAVAYAIIKHRLLDIEIIIRRSLIYSSLLFVLAVFYSSLVFVLNRLFLPEGTNSFPRVTDLIAIAVVSITGDPLKRFIEKTTDKIFFKARYNAEETISKLSEQISSIIDLNELLSALKNTLSETIKMNKMAVYLRTDHHFERIVINGGFENSLDNVVEQKYFLTEVLEKVPQLFVIEEIKQTVEEGKSKLSPEIIKSYESLMDKGVAIIVPLVSKDKISGAIFLGEKLSGDVYSNEDLKLLEILGHQAAIAIENAKLYDEQKKFASKLQVEVAKATEDLRAANDRLKELDKAKDEFVSVVSHELRTPMTAIKSYVWLVLNGRAGKLNAQMQNYLFKVYDSSERLIGMINDVLDVSHIETGRLNIELEPVSPVKVARDVIDTLSERAKELKIDLVLEKDKAIPLVAADIQKLNEIFTNLIGNALKFTKAGGKITTSFQKNGESIEISVADTGIGISKEDLPKLFSKFGRLQKSYATMATSGGSGLGLYITKNYIELMHGKVWVNSVEGKGTTFTFSLPISKSQTPIEHDPSTLMVQGMLKKR